LPHGYEPNITDATACLYTRVWGKNGFLIADILKHAKYSILSACISEALSSTPTFPGNYLFMTDMRWNGKTNERLL